MNTMSKMRKIVSVIALTAIFSWVVGPVGSMSKTASAGLVSGDYFKITAAGNATTMNAGTSLQFTLESRDASNVQNPLTGGDYAVIRIVDGLTWQSTSNMAVTALGEGMTLKASQTLGDLSVTAADLNEGTTRNLVAVNIADGTAVTNTFTIAAAAAGTYKIFIEAPGMDTWNAPGDAPLPGQSEWSITVNAGETADHMRIFPTGGGARVGDAALYTAQQVNAGNALVTTALTDVAVDVAAVSVTAGTQSALIETSSDHGLDIDDVVKFTSATNTSAYYVVSTDASNTTFKIIGATANLINSNSTVIKVTGKSAGQTNLTDAANAGAIVANTASTISMQSTTGLTVGDIVSAPGPAGYYSVTAVNAGTSITVVGPTACNAACLTENQNVTKITLTDGSASAYTASDGAGANGYISSVGGVATGNQTTTFVSGKSLSSGALALAVVCSATGTMTITPSSATLSGTDSTGSLTCMDAMTFAVKGYGPMSGQTGVPIMAPVDFVLNKNAINYGTFPMTNTASSTFSLVDSQGVAVTGTWNAFAETFSDTTSYRVSLVPSSSLTASTTYTASVKKTFVSSTDLPVGMTALTDNGTTYSFSFTTGTGGGDYVQGGEFSGNQGGSFPPMASLGYPKPGEWNVPTNISCVMVEFDRPMDTTTLTTGNIYIKKMVNGVETAVSGTPAIAIVGDENDSVCISGYTLEASSQYRVVVTRDVKDTTGVQLAGMPVDGSGNPMSGMGFGFGNMGSFKESFNTGSGSSTITATLMGLNIDKYKSGGSITGVPVGTILRATYNNPLSASTVNATNVTLKKVGGIPVAGTVTYDSMGHAIVFTPTSVLSASTSYTFAASTSVTSNSGQAISALSQAFITGTADVTSPTVIFAEADNYGIRIQFDEPMNSTNVTNKAYFTLKTCNGQAVNADGVKCADNSTDPISVSLGSGVNTHHEKEMNNLWMDGLTLTAGSGFYIGVASNVTDIAGNVINAAADTWTGFVMDSSKFDGGQGMFNQDSKGFEDFNMNTMGMTPISAMPMNAMASATTKYFIRFPVSSIVPSGGWVEFTFPAGFTVTGAKQDAQSPMKTDFNGPMTGTPTFATNLTSVTPTPTDGAGAQANDGVGYITAANKVYVKLLGATGATDFVQIDLDGITNTSEPRDPSTSGYSVQIRTFNSSGTLLESLSSMPFFISPSGTASVGGQVTAGGSGVNGVTVYLGCPFTGPMETTTANNANSGGQNGEYKFSNLPSGQCMIFTQPTFTAGAVDYTGKPNPEPITVSGTVTKNLTITAQTVVEGIFTTGATQPVTITYTQAGLSAISSLGFNDSIDIFAGSPKGFVVKTVARASLTGTSYTANLAIPAAGEWMVGIGPAMPKGPMAGGPSQINWMPPQNANVTILSTDIGGAAKTAVSLALGAADKSITGKVIDASGTAIANAEVYCYNPKGGMGSHATAGTDGTFTLNVREGMYKVGAFLPGMPNSQETSVLVSGSSVYVDGSTTASTGSSGATPFNLKINKTSSTLTIQGRVTDGTNAIANAAVWAHRTDSPAPPIHTGTDSTGNYTLYVSAGTWKIEADAPGYGYLGCLNGDCSTPTTVTTSSLTSQDFTITTSSQGSISGTINVPGTSDDSGVIVKTYGASGSNETTTAMDGTYTMNVPMGTYTIKAFVPGVGEAAAPLTTVVVDGAETNKDFTPAALKTFTVTLSTAVSEETEVNFFNATGQGNEIIIPAGSTSASITIPGTDAIAYTMDVDVPGVPFSSITPAGAEFSNTNNSVNFDGTGDNITLTLPTLYNVSGQVTSSSTGINDATVSVYNTTTKVSFAVTTANNAAGGGLDGEWLAKLPAGTYSVSADKSGYASTPVDITVAATSTGNNFALTACSRTISGTVTAGSAASGTTVYAEGAGGGFSTTTVGTDGTYTLNVSPGTWTVSAETDGYGAGTPLIVNTASTSQTSKNFTLTALTGASIPNEPQTESIVPSSGGIVSDTATNTEIIIPPNALGSETDAGSVTTKEVSDVFPTQAATPIGYGQEISATDPDGNPITTLDNQITFSLYLTDDELTAAGADTPAEADQVTIGYWDDVSNNWVPQSTTIEFYDVSGNIIPYTTVDDSATLLAAGVDYVYLTAETDHFTTFAPIITTGATPPATPTGLTPTAGDGQVTLTWTKNSESDMSSYNIWEANVTEGITSTLLHSACGTTTCSKVISSLTNGTAYAFQVAAVDTGTDTSAYCTAVNSTPVAASTPGGSPILGGGSSSKKTTEEEEETEEETEEEEVTGEEGESIEGSDTTGAGVGTGAGVSGPTPFTDIVGHWAETYIDDLYSKSVMSGASEDKFEPDSYVSRAEISKIVVTTFELETPDPVSMDTKPFKDVSINLWYASYVKAVADNGLMEGYKDGSFKPDKKITRAEALKVFLIAALGADGIEDKIATTYDAQFSDVDAGEWYAPYVNYAAEKGIINGYADGTFGPDNYLTRAEIAKIASKVLSTELVEKVIGLIMEIL